MNFANSISFLNILNYIFHQHCYTEVLLLFTTSNCFIYFYISSEPCYFEGKEVFHFLLELSYAFIHCCHSFPIHPLMPQNPL